MHEELWMHAWFNDQWYLSQIQKNNNAEIVLQVILQVMPFKTQQKSKPKHISYFSGYLNHLRWSDMIMTQLDTNCSKQWCHKHICCTSVWSPKILQPTFATEPSFRAAMQMTPPIPGWVLLRTLPKFLADLWHIVWTSILGPAIAIQQANLFEKHT